MKNSNAEIIQADREEVEATLERCCLDLSEENRIRPTLLHRLSAYRVAAVAGEYTRGYNKALSDLSTQQEALEKVAKIPWHSANGEPYPCTAVD